MSSQLKTFGISDLLNIICVFEWIRITGGYNGGSTEASNITPIIKNNCSYNLNVFHVAYSDNNNSIYIYTQKMTVWVTTKAVNNHFHFRQCAHMPKRRMQVYKTFCLSSRGKRWQCEGNRTLAKDRVNFSTSPYSNYHFSTHTWSYMAQFTSMNEISHGAAVS